MVTNTQIKNLLRKKKIKGKYEAKIIIISWHFSMCHTTRLYIQQNTEKTVILLAYAPLC